MSKESNIKQRAARLSIYSNSTLIIIKLISGVWSGSVSIISEAIHSGLDLVASFIAYFAVKISDKPADREHPYGHGKFENVSGVIESLLIFAAAIWIIYEAIYKFLHEESSINEDGLLLGIIIMFLSGVTNYFVSRHLYKVAKKTNSVALEADALHLKTDVYTSIGVSIGLTFLYFTGWVILDIIIALLVALLIIKEAYEMLMKSFAPLLDSNIEPEKLEEIKSLINNSLEANYRCDNLKSRQSGQHALIEFELVCQGNITVKEARQEAKKLKKQIESHLERTEVIVILMAE